MPRHLTHPGFRLPLMGVLALLLVSGLTAPAQAGPLRQQLDSVKVSIRWDEQQIAVQQWHALEQYMLLAYGIAGDAPAFNAEARKLCAGFLPKHEARVDALNEWIKANEADTPATLTPKLMPFSGVANTAEAMDFAYAYEVELLEELTRLQEMVTDPALKAMMTAARFESAHMADKLCDWLLYDPPAIVRETLAEEVQAQSPVA